MDFYDSNFDSYDMTDNHQLYQQAKTTFLHSELSRINEIAQKYALESNLSIEKKRELQSKLNVIKNEYPDNSDEIAPIQVQIDALKVRDLSKLSKPRNFGNKGKFKKKK